MNSRDCIYILYPISEDFSSRQNMNVLYLEDWQTYRPNEQERGGTARDYCAFAYVKDKMNTDQNVLERKVFMWRKKEKKV